MRATDDARGIQARARATFELHEFAEKVMRQNLRRRFPEESDDAIERRLVSWLRKEPRERWDGSVPPVGPLPEPNPT
jgi:hypothetical protein